MHVQPVRCLVRQAPESKDCHLRQGTQDNGSRDTYIVGDEIHQCDCRVLSTSTFTTVASAHDDMVASQAREEGKKRTGSRSPWPPATPRAWAGSSVPAARSASPRPSGFCPAFRAVIHSSATTTPAREVMSAQQQWHTTHARHRQLQKLCWQRTCGDINLPQATLAAGAATTAGLLSSHKCHAPVRCPRQKGESRTASGTESPPAKTRPPARLG